MQRKSFQRREDKSGWKTFSGNSQIDLRSTEVDLSAQYVKSDAAAICRSKCYNRLLWTKQQKEIKQDFTNDGPFRVKPLAKEPGQMPEAKKGLSFGGANVNSVNNRSH